MTERQAYEIIELLEKILRELEELHREVGELCRVELVGRKILAIL